MLILVIAGDLRTKGFRLFDLVIMVSSVMRVLGYKGVNLSDIRGLIWRKVDSSIHHITRHRLHRQLIDLTHQLVVPRLSKQDGN
jgi:hypothetical protein